MSANQPPSSRPAQVLAVVDWNVDPRPVVETLRNRLMARPTALSLLVPARLGRLDWIGNPKASCPCATQQLKELEELCVGSGLAVEAASVGDPERVPAIRTALEAIQADEVIIFERKRFQILGQWSVENRVRRNTGLPVATIKTPFRHPLGVGPGEVPRHAKRCMVPSA